MAPRGRPGEFELIARYFRPLATDPGAYSLTDDAASYAPRAGEELVFTADMIVSGVHFLPDDPAASIGHKALRVNLSDLAAKGAEPLGYLLSLGLPDEWSEAWLKGFAGALDEDQLSYGLSLWGGDTTRSPVGITIAITAIGSVPAGKMVRRAGARVGDAVFVSGTIGDAALGLKAHQGKLDCPPAAAKRLTDRYLTPEPRVALVPVLRDHATAAIDVSDGLVGDLAHICEQSDVGVDVQAGAVPLSPAAAGALAADPALLSTILNGGDDYEIVATVPAAKAEAFAREAEDAGVPVTRIGTVVAGHAPIVRDAGGDVVSLSRRSHTHF